MAPTKDISKPAARKPLTDGQRAYEARRAAKAGKTLEKHLAVKEKQNEAALRDKEKAAAPPKPAKKPGLLRRLIDKAHQPLKPPPAGKPRGAVKR